MLSSPVRRDDFSVRMANKRVYQNLEKELLRLVGELAQRA